MLSHSGRLTSSLRHSNIPITKSYVFADKDKKKTSPHTEATISSSLCIDLSGNRLNSNTIASINKCVQHLNLSRNPLGSAILPDFQALISLSLDNCNISTLRGLPSIISLRSLVLTRNQISSFDHFPVLPKLELLDMRFNSRDFTVIEALLSSCSMCLNKFNMEIIQDSDIRSAMSISPLVGIALRQGMILKEGVEDQAITFLTEELSQHLGDVTYPLSLQVVESEEGQVLLNPVEGESPTWYKLAYPENGHSIWRRIPEFDNKLIVPIDSSLHQRMIKCSFNIHGKMYSLYTDDVISRDDSLCVCPLLPNSTISDEVKQLSLVVVAPPIRSKVEWRIEDTITEGEAFTIPSDAVGKQIECRIIPLYKNHVDIQFNPYISLTSPVVPIKPVITNLSFPDTLIENREVYIERKIVPEEEGDSEIFIERRTHSQKWVKVAPLDPRFLTYTPSLEDVGHFLRLSYTPHSIYEVVGDTSYAYSLSRVLPASPLYSNPYIAGFPFTNHVLSFVADYSGGIKGNCIIKWYASRDGQEDILIAERMEHFVPSDDLEGFLIYVKAIPVRQDLVSGQEVIVQMSEPLSLETMPENPDPVSPIVGQTIYFDCKVSFYLYNKNAPFGLAKVKSGSKFTPKPKHEGQVLRVINESIDIVMGKIQAQQVIEEEDIQENDSVEEETPEEVVEKVEEVEEVKDIQISVKNVEIFQDSHGRIGVSGEVFDGEEGDSYVIYRHKGKDSKPKNVAKSSIEPLYPPEALWNQTLSALYIPVDIYGKKGVPSLSTNTILVRPLPKVIKAEILARKGHVRVGSSLVCSAKVSAHTKPTYQWFTGDGNDWQPSINCCEESYTVREKDLGLFVLCRVIATNSDGWKSDPYDAVCPIAVTEGRKILKILSTGDDFTCGNLLYTNLTDEELQTANIKWQRLANSEWIDLERGSSHLLTIDDANTKIRAITSNEKYSDTTPLIKIPSSITSLSNAVARSGSFKFLAHSELTNTLWKISSK